MNKTLERFNASQFDIQLRGQLMAELLAARPHYQALRAGLTALQVGWVEMTITPDAPIYADPRGRVHEVGLCGAAMLAVTMMADVSIAPGRTWTRKGMAVAFSGDGQSDHHVVADGRDVQWNVPGDYEVKVEIGSVGERTPLTGTVMITIA